jgi:hypothetical protein
VKLLQPLTKIDQSILAKTTLGDLTRSLGLSWIWEQYAYDAEVNTLRADIALKAFLDGEMKDNEGFMIVREGFGELIRRMREEVEKAGVEILLGEQVVAVRPSGPEIDVIKTEGSASHVSRDAFKKSKITTMNARKIIFATHALGLADIEGFKSWPLLRYVVMRPLVRIYAAFPVAVGGAPWFAGIGKIVTMNPIRNFIPINAEAGTAMISYTDGEWAEPFLNMVDKGKGSQEKLEGVVMHHLRRLFPDRSIPDPDLFKVYGWSEGCTYWLPGEYDPAGVSRQALMPFPDVYVCGESFSMRQAWIEGSLEHAGQLWKLLDTPYK